VARLRPGALVLGCDSPLELDGVARGKPADGGEALALWAAMAGRRGTLHTGHCLLDTSTGRRQEEVASTVVRFGRPSEAELAAYVARGEPLTLAGGFSIEGLGAPFVEGVDGDPGNVLGLSMPLLRRLLGRLGLSVTDLWRRRVLPVVRPVGPGDRAWVQETIERRWGLPVVSTSGVHDPGALPGFVAEDDGERLGVLTYRADDAQVEVVTLDSLVPRQGVGSGLLDAVHRMATQGGRRLWLVTTDDNVEALGFYLRRGMELVAVHRGFGDEVRRRKPGVEALGAVPLRSALEFEFPPRP
jgi:predicted house-cleaning NTP pyrophosphatase (Maf/HAM1 superfamily)/GNAT superfamily N-acetyltransferase